MSGSDQHWCPCGCLGSRAAAMGSPASSDATRPCSEGELTTEHVREQFGSTPGSGFLPEAAAERESKLAAFDRWLDSVKVEAAANAKPFACDICGRAMPYLTSRERGITPATVRDLGPNVLACGRCYWQALHRATARATSCPAIEGEAAEVEYAVRSADGFVSHGAGLSGEVADAREMDPGQTLVSRTVTPWCEVAQ